jgi:hypothetical protein
VDLAYRVVFDLDDDRIALLQMWRVAAVAVKDPE